MAIQCIEKNFFTRDVLDLAPALLGKHLVRSFPGGIPRYYIITETEAYRGEDDLACHASRGRTPRTEVMYREGGILYVYLVYGIHWMLNIVTGITGDPQAVLIRGLKEINRPDQTKGANLSAGLQEADHQLEPHSGRKTVQVHEAGKMHEISGPGRLTKALGIDASFNGEPLCTSQRIWLEETGITLPHTTTPRIGIDYAGEPWKSKPWRFIAGDF